MSFGKAAPIQSYVVVVVPCPCKFHICSDGPMPIQIFALWLWISTHPGSTSRILWPAPLETHICCTEPMSIQTLSSFCRISSQPVSIAIVLSHCLSETHTCLWCADAHVDAPIIGSVSTQPLYLCLWQFPTT